MRPRRLSVGALTKPEDVRSAHGLLEQAWGGLGALAVQIDSGSCVESSGQQTACVKNLGEAPAPLHEACSAATLVQIKVAQYHR